MKKESGVMVIKDGKAWGKAWEDGNATGYGWIEPEDAPIYDPRYVLSPLDITYKASHYEEEILKGKVVKCVRITTVEFF